MPDHFWISLIIMAGTTYLIRMLPFVLVKGKIKNRFVRSFFAYTPYAVLGAMTFPAVFYSTSNLLAAVLGVVVALILAFREKSLLTVSLSACAVVFLAEYFLIG